MAQKLVDDDNNLVLFDDVRVSYGCGFEEVGQNALADAKAIEQSFANTKKNADKIESVAGRIADFESSIDDLEDDVKANSKAADSLQSSVKKNEDKIESQAEDISDLQSSVDDTEDKISSNADALDSLTTDVKKQGDDIKSQAEDIRDLSTSLDDTKADIEANADSISSTRTTVEKQGDTIKSHGDSLDKLSADYSDLEDDVESKASIKQLEEVEADVEGASARALDQLRSEFQTIDIIAPGETNSTTKSRSVINLIQNVENNIDEAIAQQIEELSTDFEKEIEDLQDAIESSVSMKDVENAISDAEESIGERLSSMESEYKGYRDDLEKEIESKASIEQLEQVKSDNEGASAELRNTLAAEFNTVDIIAPGEANGVTRSSAVEQLIKTGSSGSSSESFYAIRLQNESTEDGKNLAGFGIGLEGDKSTVIFNTDDFAVGNPDSDSAYPFIVSDDTVYMKEAMIQELTFSKLVSDDGNSVVTDDKIKAKYLQVGGKSGGGELKIDEDGIRGYDSSGDKTWEANNDGTLTIKQANVIDSAQIADRPVLAPYNFYYDSYREITDHQAPDKVSRDKEMIKAKIKKKDMKGVKFIIVTAGVNLKLKIDTPDNVRTEVWGYLELNGEEFSKYTVMDTEVGSNRTVNNTGDSAQTGGTIIEKEEDIEIRYYLHAYARKTHKNGIGNDVDWNLNLSDAYMTVHLMS